MLLKGFKQITMGVAGLLIASAAIADGPKVNLEYRAGLTHDDGKVMETDDMDASASSDIALEVAKIHMSGDAAENVGYYFKYNAISSSVEIANATLKWSDMISFSVGRDKINQGGWMTKAIGNGSDLHTSFAKGYYMQKPFDTFSDQVGFHFALAGKLNIQLLNDVMYEDSDGDNARSAGDSNMYARNDTNKGPAATVEWEGNFSGWMPLVQLVSYDLNNSMAWSLGVKGKVAGLGMMLNYGSDARKNHAAGVDDAETDTLNQIDVKFSYGLGSFTPFLGYHSFDYKQGGTDSDVNSADDAMDDNAQSIIVGVECDAVGTGYVPYLTLNSNSGTYAKADGSDETRSGMVVKVGVHGKF